MEIIDFHTHPFLDSQTNICCYKDFLNMTPENVIETLKEMGISKICGSVIGGDWDVDKGFENIKSRNDIALKLKEEYDGYYIPGFCVHPNFVRESLEEIERMHRMGVNLIGELVPYMDNWNGYYSKEFMEILKLARDYKMIVSLHTMDEDGMEKIIESNKDITFVVAHPGEYDCFMRHIQRMKKYENYYLDLSGTGLFRYGMLRYGIDKCGADRFLFGTDFPICNPAMYIGGIFLDSLISDGEKEKILFDNAKRILNI